MQIAIDDLVGQKLPAGFPKWRSGRLNINKTSFVEPIKESDWKFRIGSHQILRKFLRDRQSRILTRLEIETYLKIVRFVKVAQATMTEIDVTISNFGGWPNAFAETS